MRRFDFSFLDGGMIPADLVNLAAGIYSLRAAEDFRKTERSQVFLALEGAARARGRTASTEALRARRTPTA